MHALLWWCIGKLQIQTHRSHLILVSTTFISRLIPSHVLSSKIEVINYHVNILVATDVSGCKWLYICCRWRMIILDIILYFHKTAKLSEANRQAVILLKGKWLNTLIKSSVGMCARIRLEHSDCDLLVPVKDSSTRFEGCSHGTIALLQFISQN